MTDPERRLRLAEAALLEIVDMVSDPLRVAAVKVVERALCVLDQLDERDDARSDMCTCGRCPSG